MKKLEQLDKVLDCLEKNRHAYQTDIEKLLPNIDPNIISLALKKLEKDGFVFWNNGRHTITFDGIYFNETGGYSKKIESEKAIYNATTISPKLSITAIIVAVASALFTLWGLFR